MLSARDALDDEGQQDKRLRVEILKFFEDLYDICDIDGDSVLSRKELGFGHHLSTTSRSCHGSLEDVAQYEYSASDAEAPRSALRVWEA